MIPLSNQTSSQDRSTAPNFMPILVALIPLLGALIYVSLRGEYVRTYSRFGVTPEDVGIDYFTVLTGAFRIIRGGNLEAVPAPLAILIVAVLIGLLVSCTYRWRRRLLRPGSLAKWPKRRLRRLSPVLYWLSTASVGRLLTLDVTIVLLFVVIVFQAVLPSDSRNAIRHICHGERIRPGNLNLLAVQAYQANILPNEPDKDVTKAPYSDRVLYLGRAGGMVTFYDYRNGSTWRIPESSITIQMSPFDDAHAKSDKVPGCGD